MQYLRRLAIAGGTGFIGRHLVCDWLNKGMELLIISRNSNRNFIPSSSIACVQWDQLEERAELFEGLDAVVNLAGESINSGRWTRKRKKRIMESRIESTRKIARLTARLRQKPRVVINGSAIGIYGFSETEPFDEKSTARGTDFLASVVDAWEREADLIPAPRLIKLRTGIVLGPDGGAFPMMVMPYHFFLGGRVGTGKQWLSWIHIEDMVRIINFCIENEAISGPVNATAPNPVTNDQFGRAVAKFMGKPHWLPVPGTALKLLFGEMAEILLKGQKVLPQKLLEHGFSFRYPEIDPAVQNLVSCSRKI